MNHARLAALLERIAQLRVLVVGDYFLDKYLVIDQALAQTSLETGLEARQVVAVRHSPGAAGNLAANVAALKAQTQALSVIGDDGEGYELRRALTKRGVDVGAVLSAADRFTPTYVKPMLQEHAGPVRELNRLDIQNRTPLPAALEDALIARLDDLAPSVQAVAICDQTPAADTGVITTKVRAALEALAKRYEHTIFAVDSRARIGMFRGAILKPNEREAVAAIMPGEGNAPDWATIERCGRALQQHCGRAVFLTRGENGMLVFSGGRVQSVPARGVEGPIDTVGAGDSAMAGIVSALAAGATETEAAEMGALIASVTIRQIGVTGTATPAQVMEARG